MTKSDTLLWKLTSENGSESYLFGTMHIADSTNIEDMEKIKSLILKCGFLANEMDLGHSHLMDVSEVHMEEELSMLVGDKKYGKLRNIIFKAFNADLEQLKHLKPLIITNVLAEVVLGNSGRIGLDYYLYEFAKKHSIPTTGVEDVETQAEIMNKIPMEFQVKSLLSIGKNVKGFRSKVLEMSRLYQEKKLKSLHKKAKRSLGGMRRILLYDRNLRMAEKIAEMIRENSYFVAIGAGHLYGAKGVLRLLKKMDVEVSPVHN